ncbi:MAG: flagellar biosynthesis regulator FlaF [Rhizobiaceae bacterium]|nr:flagellar biosynthesis regulator FlaF [Rhizobiaceae bacterium]MCV0407002.1 flagellar biosynthesis regulator FlaF [Rhizobiaceae bacterium]
MYQFSYADVQSDSVADAKDRESQLIDRSIEMLEKAKDAGLRSLETVEAVHFVNRIWSTMIEDLANPENALPNELRANLISIGLWLLRGAEAVRQGESDDLDGLIEISQIIRDGLR